jgi:hypothetical protein
MNLSFKAEKDDSIQRKIRRERLRKYRRNWTKDAFGGTGAEPEYSLELEDAMDQQKLWSLGLVAWKLELLEQTRFGERKNRVGCIYDPEDLLRSCGRLRIKGDNWFEEISERKDYLLRNWGHVLTPFFGKKTGQKA